MGALLAQAAIHGSVHLDLAKPAGFNQKKSLASKVTKSTLASSSGATCICSSWWRMSCGSRFSVRRLCRGRLLWPCTSTEQIPSAWSGGRAGRQMGKPGVRLCLM